MAPNDWRTGVKKILFASNEQDLLLSVQERLTKNGFEVYQAQNGQQAYDSAFRHNPDLIVSDAVLPVMSGFELCKTLRESAYTKHIPVIILSGKNNMEDSFLFLGIKDFIPKPVDLEKLEARIKDRLSRPMHAQRTKVLFHCVKELTMRCARALFEQTPQWLPEYVNSGKDLLVKAREFFPDLIVADLFMDDIPIDEVITWLKQIPELSHSEILTYYSPVSGAADSLSMQAKMIEVQYLKRVTAEAGAREYLGPFNEANFMGLLKEYSKDHA